MAAPVGNNNASKGRKWRDAINKALAQSGGSIDAGVLKIAAKLVEQALEGEQWAIQEIGNRLDGKPAQALIHQGDDEQPVVLRIDRVIVDPNNPNR